MRHTSAQYAQALYDLTNDKSDHAASSIIYNFVQTLTNNKDLALVDSICKEFGHINSRHRENHSPEIIVAHKSDAETIVGKISQLTGAKIIVDPSLLGGAQIRLGDKLIDNSIASRIKKLKRALLT